MKFEDFVIGKQYSMRSTPSYVTTVKYKDNDGILFVRDTDINKNGHWWRKEDFYGNENYWVEIKPKRYQVIYTDKGCSGHIYTSGISYPSIEDAKYSFVNKNPFPIIGFIEQSNPSLIIPYKK